MKPGNILTVFRNTINLWLRRKAKTGDFRAKVSEHRGKNNKIADWEKFRAFAETYGDKTQVEMAQLSPKLDSVGTLGWTFSWDS